MFKTLGPVPRTENGGLKYPGASRPPLAKAKPGAPERKTARPCHRQHPGSVFPVRLYLPLTVRR